MIIFKQVSQVCSGWMKAAVRRKAVPHQGKCYSKHQVLQWQHSDRQQTGLLKGNTIPQGLLLANSRSEMWPQGIWSQVPALPRHCPVPLPLPRVLLENLGPLSARMACIWYPDSQESCLIDRCHVFVFTVPLSASLIPIPPEVCLKYLRQNTHLLLEHPFQVHKFAD